MKTIMLSPQTDENAVKAAADLILQGEVVACPQKLSMDWLLMP